MKKKIWVHKAKSFQEAEKFEKDYYLAMFPLERLEIMQFLREAHFKFKKRFKNEGRERLRRIIKIIQ